MFESTRKNIGTWDTAVGLVLGLLLLFAQFPLMFTSLGTLLISLGALSTTFSMFLLRAAWGRRLPLVFLTAPIAVWSAFWFASTKQVTQLLPIASVAGGTILALLLVPPFRRRGT